MKIKMIAGLGLAALALPASAAAHVTVQPTTAPAGGFTELQVRVPNERDDAATSKVEVQLPDGFIFVSYEPVPGWEAEVKTEKLAEPVEVFGEEQTEQVATVTWTATDPEAAVQPGQFRDFPLSVGMPSEAVEGDVLTFPAIQTYDSGEVVRWIGAEDSEAPAAAVTVIAGEEESHDAAAADDAGTATTGEPAADPVAADDAEADDGEDEDSNTLAIVALIVGGLGLAAGGFSLARSRR